MGIRDAVSAEDFLEVESLEFELAGPDGQPVEMKRWSSEDVDTPFAVSSPPPTTGPALADMAAEMIPGRKLWQRLRGES